MFDYSVPEVPQISADEVFKLIESKDDLIILDVRTKDEFKRNRIKNAINIPLDEIETKKDLINNDKDKKLIVYCLSSSRSVFAVQILIKLGFTNVFNMTSGLLAWRANKLPLEN